MKADMDELMAPNESVCNETLRADSFVNRHIGPQLNEQQQMLKALGLSTLGELVKKTVPSQILRKAPLALLAGISEHEVLSEIRNIAKKNKVFRSYIGQGYHDTLTPPVIQRNILENPGWYTQYTPYQAEIAQGRLEALINFQTMVSDLTGMQLANASLLDEGTAAAEAMTFCLRVKNRSTGKFFVSTHVHPQTLAVVTTRALPLGIEVVVGDEAKIVLDDSYFGALLQYPHSDGQVVENRTFVESVHALGGLVIVAADLLSLTLLTPPGEWGADVVVGNTQRFGVPMGCGGPHAAFFATKEEFKRQIPGRIIGVSKDKSGKPAYRLALQVREQHIRRETATSNICTAQVLLAVMASMYAVYHGAQGLRNIARGIHLRAVTLKLLLEAQGVKMTHSAFFDTLHVIGVDSASVQKRTHAKEMNFRFFQDGSIGIALDETTTNEDLVDILEVLTGKRASVESVSEAITEAESSIPQNLQRKTPYLTHAVFSRYHTETELLRYMNRLQSKDLSLTSSMIPLGSCTMKLNATTEMIPVTWPEFGRIHPFAPAEQLQGYAQLVKELEAMLSEITGFADASVQPNAGSQGEYAGLLAIREYHRSRGESYRTLCLIPDSAHGTNPASAVLAGMEVISVLCDESGNIDLTDLKVKAAEHKDHLGALMVTYPSTHGVFEESIKEICALIHQHGGQVYMDGANLNAQVGLTAPGEIGADVCHINLHKTFCIPHGGGGPGVGPIAVASHLAPFLPKNPITPLAPESFSGAVSAAPWGSASVLPISWVYVKLMGSEGLKRATEVAILNANYLAKKLEGHYEVLYKGKHGFVAHECILDLRHLKREIGIEVGDIAKRLMDYGFHAPTVSFPVVETLMVEPTESENKAELDRFVDAMISIREEIRAIEQGKMDKLDNPLKNAPHTAISIAQETWTHPYTREQAAFPLAWQKEFKFWPAVERIDNTYGDRNLFCSCM